MSGTAFAFPSADTTILELELDCSAAPAAKTARKTAAVRKSILVIFIFDHLYSYVFSRYLNCSQIFMIYEIINAYFKYLN
jgi:hypothetical protein